MNKQRGYTIFERAFLVWGIVILAGVVGWVMNIVDIIHSDFSNVDGMLVVRIIATAQADPERSDTGS